jgi:hypothetical protein
MTREEFAEALRQLRLPHSSALTARLLGISARQVNYCLAGHCKVAKSVAVICRLLLLLDGAGFPPGAIDGVLAAPVPAKPAALGPEPPGF